MENKEKKFDLATVLSVAMGKPFAPAEKTVSLCERMTNKTMILEKTPKYTTIDIKTLATVVRACGERLVEDFPFLQQMVHECGKELLPQIKNVPKEKRRKIIQAWMNQKRKLLPPQVAKGFPIRRGNVSLEASGFVPSKGALLMRDLLGVGPRPPSFG